MKCSKLKKVEGRFELEHMRRKPKHLVNRKLHHLTEITTNREQTPSLHAHAGRTNTKYQNRYKKSRFLPGTKGTACTAPSICIGHVNLDVGVIGEFSTLQ